MRWVAIVAGVALSLSALTGCTRGVVKDPWADTVAPDVLDKMALAYFWRTSALPIDRAGGETLTRLWRLDENVYALTSRNRLLAVDAATGQFKWSNSMAVPALRVFAPCHASDVIRDSRAGADALTEGVRSGNLKTFDAVIVNTITYALIIDRANGEIVRKLDLKFAANSAGATDGDYLYLGSVRGRYHAIRLCDGLIPGKGTRSTGDMITAAPVVYNRRLYVASQDKKFYATYPNSARPPLWVQTTDGPLTGGFVVDERGSFVPSQDYRLYAYDLATGEELWTPFRTQGPLRQAVQVGQRTAFQYAENDRFYAIDVGSGRKRWDIIDGRMVLAAAGTDVYVLNDKARLLQVHESLGEIKKVVPLTGLDLFVPNATKDVIYAARRDGYIACLRPAAAGQLTADMLKN